MKLGEGSKLRIADMEHGYPPSEAQFDNLVDYLLYLERKVRTNELVIAELRKAMWGNAHR